MPKIAVFAPMPSVSMPKADSANPGLLRKPRTAYTSCLTNSFIHAPVNYEACRMPAVLTRTHGLNRARETRSVRLWDSCVRFDNRNEVTNRWESALFAPYDSCQPELQ